MEYVLKQDNYIKVKVKEVSKNTVISHKLYGEIVVTEGNFVLKFLTGMNKGEEIGITKTDLDNLYDLLEK